MLEPLRSLSLLGSSFALLAACSAAPAPAPQAPTADAEGKLTGATRAHEDLAKQLAAAPQDLLAQCRTTSGDCLISVAERREALIAKHYLSACRNTELEQQGSCVARELEKQAKRSELASFYETENWCSRKLLECISAVTSSAEQMAIRKLARERREVIEAAPESLAAQRAPEFAKERRDFVRAILPPKGQAECAPLAPEACEKKLQAPSAELEAELVKAADAYDEKRARALYAALQRAEADCNAPELRCLREQIQQFGGSPESDKLLEQNLSLISQQQTIRVTANPEAADSCVSAGVTQHSDRIVSAYQAYAGAPSSFALLRLQKAFVAMHQAQLWCLMPLAKGKR